MAKKYSIFVVKRLHFSNFMDFSWVGPYLWKKLRTMVGLGLSLKNLDWMWIADFDSPLISGSECSALMFIHQFLQNDCGVEKLRKVCKANREMVRNQVLHRKNTWKQTQWMARGRTQRQVSSSCTERVYPDKLWSHVWSFGETKNPAVD